MKVLIIKNCKEGKVDDIVEVANGYAKNFLIKHGLALPINDRTVNLREKHLKIKDNFAAQLLKKAQELKEALEKLTLTYEVKVTKDVIHGSITRKKIINDLKAKNINIDVHAMDNVKIHSLGLTKINVKLHKKINATLKIEVKENGK